MLASVDLPTDQNLILPLCVALHQCTLKYQIYWGRSQIMYTPAAALSVIASTS